MAPGNSIKRALLRPGHFLKLYNDRLLYEFPARSLGGLSVFPYARTDRHRMACNDRKRVKATPTRGGNKRWLKQYPPSPTTV